MPVCAACRSPFPAAHTLSATADRTAIGSRRPRARTVRAVRNGAGHRGQASVCRNRSDLANRAAPRPAAVVARPGNRCARRPTRRFRRAVDRLPTARNARLATDAARRTTAHSAVTHSAVAHSAVVHSAVSHSAVGQSAVGHSAVGHSAVGRRRARWFDSFPRASFTGNGTSVFGSSVFGSHVAAGFRLRRGNAIALARAVAFHAAARGAVGRTNGGRVSRRVVV